MNVVVWISVCWRLKAAIESKSQGIWKNQFNPGPLEDRLVRLERVLARRDEDDEAAHDERDQHREERRDEPARPLREGETLAEALLRVG